MKAFLTLLIAFFLINFCNAQTFSLEAKKIFKGSSTKLSVIDKNAIAVKFGFKLLKNGSWKFEDYIFDSDAISVLDIDLNSDGVEEIFINVASGEYFGNTGTGFSLFMKDKKGQYQTLFDLQTGIPEVSETTTKGFFDIIFAGSGFEFPLYVWNGTQYKFVKTISQDHAILVDETTIHNTTLPSAELKNETLSLHATDLFKDTKSKLANVQKNKITQLLGYIANSNKKNKKIIPLPVDLNSDGIEEIFILTKTTLLGIPSNEYAYYIQDNNKQFKLAIGTIPITMKIIINENKVGYPFIVTGKVGQNREVWQWINNAYKAYLTVAAKDSYLLKLKSIEDASLEYTSKI